MQIQHRKYFSDITSVSDYYPFGSKMYGRRWEPVKPLYRFGFNTQEKVNEISPDHYTAKYWEYDARLGRRWNVDPKPQAGVSNYAVNEDNPIRWNDPLGDIPPELLVRGGKITSSFQPREKITEGGQKIFYVHRAMDIAAQVGKKIHSYASGTVVIVGTEKDKSGKLKGWGNYIVIKHNEGFYSLYAHLDKLPNLKLGQKVQNDEIIGNVGKTGSATGPHLHIEIGKAKNLSEFLSNKQETRLNPEKIGDLEKFIDFYKENKDKINIDEYKKNTTDNIEKVNLNKK
ncbi:MAG: peptidoglycan DD-metalloendopeptidase family protein [Bacteroidota bacterium]